MGEVTANETLPPVRAYEVDWDGERYVARCAACLMECEGSASKPEAALRQLMREALCTLRHREMGLRERARGDL